MIKVTLQNGSSISTTPEHRFIVWEQGAFKEKEAAALVIGNRIACASAVEQGIQIGHGGLQLVSANGDVTFSEVASLKQDFADTVYDFTVPETHNFVAEGMVIHNTTLSDNLLAGAGMIAEAQAGKQQFMDYDPQEQERGITIYAANASMVHEVNGQEFLVNLIDTPGHVDFGGDVTRAMRAVDGVVVVNDAVEGIMPQTETVIRQALKERVKPVLYVNKVDRLIKELKLTPEQMQERFKKIVTEVNLLIQKYCEEQYKDQWTVDVAKGSVAFGSATKKWAISFPIMQKAGLKFKDIIELTEQDRHEELAARVPLHKTLLDMVVTHLPDPVHAQKYRVQKIWPGDIESQVGKAMVTCDSNGPLAGVVTKLYPDPHAGYVATVRLLSGKVRKGQDVWLVMKQKNEKVQQVGVYKGPKLLSMDEVLAGNIVGIVGLKDASSGETICSQETPIPGFEAITHIFEPVVTKAIEAKKPQQLAKLIDFLKKTAREDPTLRVKINEDTGEYLVSGLGELHLDAKIERKLKEEGIDVTISPPIVIYRESTRGKPADWVEGKSPNKHNKLYVLTEPVPKPLMDAMVSGDVKDQEVKKKATDLVETLIKHGMDRDDAKSVLLISGRNIFIDDTHGVHGIQEIMELVKEAFEEAVKEGPLAREPVSGVIVRLMDAKLHEDTIHRGPAQIIPAMRRAIRSAMVQGGAFILEPKQIIRIDVPTEHLGGASKEINNRRGQILEMSEERGVTSIKTKIPVADMFGFNSALKSSTGGLGFYWLIDIVYEPLPKELEPRVVRSIRERKGILTEEEKDEAE